MPPSAGDPRTFQSCGMQMDADKPGNMTEEEKIRSYWVILKYLIIDYFGTDILKDANPLFIVCDLQEDHQRWVILGS